MFLKVKKPKTLETKECFQKYSEGKLANSVLLHFKSKGNPSQREAGGSGEGGVQLSFVQEFSNVDVLNGLASAS